MGEGIKDIENINFRLDMGDLKWNVLGPWGVLYVISPDPHRNKTLTQYWNSWVGFAAL